jgi:uncharacterized coiled-coil protein SlyX
MSQQLENRIDKLEDTTGQLVVVMNKLEVVIESNAKEQERHNRKLEEIIDSLSNFTNFMQMTNYRFDEIKKGSSCKIHSESAKKDMKTLEDKIDYNHGKILKLTEYTQDNTSEGCSALKLAISEDQVSKNDLKHLTDKVDEMNANITWLWRAVAGSMIAVAVKMFILQ